MHHHIGNCIKFFIVIFLLFISNSIYAQKNTCEQNTIFKIGTGIRDITGPAAEEGMMGYGMLAQQTSGVLQRLWARAFIIESPCNAKRVVFVNADLGQIFQGVKQQVIARLQKKYGDVYRDENVLLTATHTHSGPGGFSTYAFYNITTLGFSRENFDTIVNGIVNAISFAHNNMTEAKIKFAEDELTNISYNRSPTSYLLNPATERARYAGDTDTQMSLIRFDSLKKKPLGLINWYPIHGVSMNNKNHLINGDNKGYAEYLFEKDFQSNYRSWPFIAAFAQANAGDVSPNPLGHEGGTGEEGLKAIEKAGRPQYAKAKELFNQASELLIGEVDYRHIFIAMDQVKVDPKYTNGIAQMTCPAAIGLSMLAGTQDGEGIGKQGQTCSDPISTMPLFCELSTTTCQGVKPIIIQTGLMEPYPWTPNILPLQILKIGNLVIVAAPFELTTMTGRRIKEAVANQFPANDHVVLSTLANAYSGYVATREEYEAQRYEAASTHFGPWTEAALKQEFTKLAQSMVKGEAVNSTVFPLDLKDVQIDLQPGVFFDTTPLGKDFGDIKEDVAPKYKPGDIVKVSFWGAHPKNNYRTETPTDTFLLIQYLAQSKSDEWQTISNDNDWETSYNWGRSGISDSIITIEWRIPKNIIPGTYRIVHFGDKKTFIGEIIPYVGYSSSFKVE